MQKILAKTKESLLDSLLQKATGDTDILAVFLFGSLVKGEACSSSDIDICMVLTEADDKLYMSRKKLEYTGICDIDISIFQQLPLYIKQRVLKEGQLLFCRDEDRLYRLAIETVKEYEDFKHIYHEYLGNILYAR